MTDTAISGRPLRRVEHHMGTAISLATHDADEAVANRFFARVASYELLFSRYLVGSEISRLARGELELDAAAPEVREVLTRCEQLRTLTRGCFDHRGGRELDPNGLAKGWIIQRSTLVFPLAGVTSFFVNAGGDILVGDAPPGRDGWRVGVRHPDHADAAVAVLDLERTAIATSATYERGDHIRPARTAAGSRSVGAPLMSVSVVGPDLGVADALATAVHASGDDRPAWWGSARGYDVLTVAADRRVRWTSGLDGRIVEVGQSGG